MDERAVQQHHHGRGRQADYVLETAVLSAFSSLLSSRLLNVNWRMCNDSTLTTWRICGFSFLNHDDFIQSHLLSSIKADKYMAVLGARTFFWRQDCHLWWRLQDCTRWQRIRTTHPTEETAGSTGQPSSPRGRSLWPKCPVVTRVFSVFSWIAALCSAVCPDSKNLGEEYTVYSKWFIFHYATKCSSFLH